MKSFIHRWNLALLATSLIPLLISFILVMAITSGQMRSIAIDSILKESERSHRDIENRMEQIGLVCDSMTNYAATELARSAPATAYSYGELRRFESFKNMVTGIEDIYTVTRIRIYTDSLPFVRAGDRRTYFLLDDLADSEVDVEQVRANNSTNRLNYILLDAQVVPAKNYGQYSLISFHRSIYDMHKNLIAVLFFDFDRNTFLNQTAALTPGSGIRLENAAGEVCCEKGTIEPFDAEAVNQDGYVIQDGSLIFRAPVTRTDWTLTIATPIHIGVNVWSSLSGVYLLILLLASGLSLGVGGMLSYASIRRLRTFYEAVRDADFTAGDSMKTLPDRLDELTDKRHHIDEVDQIMSAFASLIRDNLKMIDGVRQRDLNIEKYKLQVLQEQINPHFLYNALDTLRLCMTLRRPDDALRTLDALTRFYRIALSKGRDTIAVSEEMDMICCYLEIENVGYGGRLKWNTQVEPGLGELPIPKFLIQPLIENSIVHGRMRKGSQYLTIDISVHMEGDMVIIRVADDGIGINPEALKRLNRSLTEENPEGVRAGGFGLYNVNQRLILFYGSDYGLRVNGGEYGTENIIRLPVGVF